MAFSTRVLLDSISPAGVRLTTMEVTFHRFVLPEFNTHRAFSRNAASSRAIPIKKVIAAVRSDPALPIFWGKNQSGMAARQEIDEAARERARAEWQRALDNALESAERLASSDIDLHKQLVNRILEPFAWITVIVSAKPGNHEKVTSPYTGLLLSSLYTQTSILKLFVQKVPSAGLFRVRPSCRPAFEPFGGPFPGRSDERSLCQSDGISRRIGAGCGQAYGAVASLLAF